MLALLTLPLSAVQAWQMLCRHIAKLGYPFHTGTWQALQQALALVYQRWEQYAQKQSRPDRPTILRQLQQEIVKWLT